MRGPVKRPVDRWSYMRILLVNKYAKITGGSDLHCLDLCEGLRGRGHQVIFLSTYDDDNRDCSGVFIPTSVTNESRSEMRGGKALRVAARAVWNPQAADAMRALLDEFRPDIIHAHKLYPQLSVAPISVAARRGVPIVQTVHDYEFISASAIDDRGRWLDHDETRFSYRSLNSMLFIVKRLFHLPHVNHWISVSRSTSEAYDARNIPTTVLPNFTRPYVGVAPSFDARSGVLFIGRLSEEKGLRHILELPSYLPELPIVIAGDGPLRDQVKRAAQNATNLTYRGRLDRKDVAGELASARVVVMPSLWREPGPLAALEAMAAGTPLVVYNNGGLAEYVSDADAGVIVSASVNSLAAAVKAIYSDRVGWETLASNARKAIQRDHTIAVYLDGLEQIYVGLRDADLGRRDNRDRPLP
jgi:glycosyltransferase involved in cell wall biosynthesis